MLEVANQYPYFDDFDSRKNFVSVLFKPAKPVQVRELNTMQSIQRDQIKKFGDHIFKNGSIVEGQAPSRLTMPFVVLQSRCPHDNSKVDPNRLIGRIVVGQATDIRAKIVDAKAATVDEPPVLYLDYKNTGKDGKTHRFQPGETLVISNNNLVEYIVRVRCPECSPTDNFDDLDWDGPIVGFGDVWLIPDATYYVNGFFYEHPQAYVVANKFGAASASYSVGFSISYDIVDVDEDYSLYDNALGYPNYGAPGADRFRVILSPVVRKYGAETDTTFILLAGVYNGYVRYAKKKPEYGELMDVLAERTYDESGNYTVNGFDYKLHEHLRRDETVSEGLFLKKHGGDADKFVMVIGPGKAYVKGYQIHKTSDSMVEFDKARDKKVIRDYYDTFEQLDYIIVAPLLISSFFPMTLGETTIFNNRKVFLYKQNAVDGVTGTMTDIPVGYIMAYDVRIHNIDLNGRVQLRLYYTKMKLEPGVSFSQVNSVAQDAAHFISSTVPHPITGDIRTYSPNKSPLIWKIIDYLASTRDADDSSRRSLTYQARVRFEGVINAGVYDYTATTGEIILDYNEATTIAAVYDSTNGSMEIIEDLGPKMAGSTPFRLELATIDPRYDGKPVVIFHMVQYSDVQEKTKTLANIIEGVSASEPNPVSFTVDANGDDVLVLKRADLYRINSINKVTDGKNVTDRFTTTTGQNDYAYVPIMLKPNNPSDFVSTDTFIVDYDYFHHSPTGHFFSIESYKGLINDTSIDFSIGDVPVFQSKSKDEFVLKDCLDFRPLILSEQEATRNEAITLPSLYVSNYKQPYLFGSFTCDVTQYIPGIDYLVLTKDGEFKQKKGISKSIPEPPKIPADGSELPLYIIEQKAFVNNINTDVKVTRYDTKRYTMRDIGKLEKRFEKIEYYTSFALMEMQMENMTVTDSNGLDRFKNGFVADNFQNFQAAYINDIEFKACLDRKDATLRPTYTMFNQLFGINKTASTGLKFVDNIAMLEYNDELFTEQPKASRSISTMPGFVYNQVGSMILDPPYDSWCDMNQQTKINMNIDMPAILAQDPWGVEYGSWNHVNISTHDLGEPTVTDVSLLAYMRSIPVRFVLSGLRPNTILQAWFDGVDVSQHCRMLSVQSSYGESMYTDEQGNMVGEFLIPEAAFFNGQKEFLITNRVISKDDSDSITTSARSIYWAGGLDLSTQETTMNIITPITQLPDTTPIVVVPGGPGASCMWVADPWGDWSECVPSGGGNASHTRNRSVYKDPDGCAEPTNAKPATSETEDCIPGEDTGVCEWKILEATATDPEGWGNPTPCVGGVQHQYRTIVTSQAGCTPVAAPLPSTKSTPCTPGGGGGVAPVDCTPIDAGGTNFSWQVDFSTCGPCIAGYKDCKEYLIALDPACNDQLTGPIEADCTTPCRTQSMSCTFEPDCASATWVKTEVGRTPDPCVSGQTVTISYALVTNPPGCEQIMMAFKPPSTTTVNCNSAPPGNEIPPVCDYSTNFAAAYPQMCMGMKPSCFSDLCQIYAWYGIPYPYQSHDDICPDLYAWSSVAFTNIDAAISDATLQTIDDAKLNIVCNGITTQIGDCSPGQANCFDDPNQMGDQVCIDAFWNEWNAVTIAAGNPSWNPVSANTRLDIQKNQLQLFHDKLVESGAITRKDLDYQICDSGAGQVLLDPVAQTFQPETDCFISSVDLFFHTVDPNDIVFVQIRGTNNGYPSEDILVERKLTANLIKKSEDSRSVTNVRFQIPVFVERNKTYALVVGSNNIETRVWASQLGETDLITGTTINIQPHLGSLFISQNGTTWEASIKKDMKFRMYRAVFDNSKSAKLVLGNKKFENERSVLNPFTTKAGSNKIRVYSPNHGMSAGDRFRPRLNENAWLQIVVTDPVDMNPAIGMKIENSTGSAYIRESIDFGTLTDKMVKLYNIEGYFDPDIDSTFVSTPPAFSLEESYIFSQVLGYEFKPPAVPNMKGTIKSTLHSLFNGIGAEEFNKTQTVASVESSDSYIFEVTTPATESGYVGGYVKLGDNQRYDKFNISGSILDYGTDGKWKFTGMTKYNDASGHTTEAMFINLAKDYDLAEPNVVLNSLNENIFGVPSLQLEYEFTPKDKYTSPMMNIGTLSFTGIANSVDMRKDTDYTSTGIFAYYPETDPTKGVEPYKYVTKEIKLADPSNDIKIYLDVHKPPDSDFDIYVKYASSGDGDVDFDDIDWNLIDDIDKNFVSNADGQYREIEANFDPHIMVNGALLNVEIQRFSIKIVGRTKNSSRPPLFKMLRAMALT